MLHITLYIYIILYIAWTIFLVTWGVSNGLLYSQLRPDYVTISKYVEDVNVKEMVSQ